MSENLKNGTSNAFVMLVERRLDHKSGLHVAFAYKIQRIWAVPHSMALELARKGFGESISGTHLRTLRMDLNKLLGAKTATRYFPMPVIGAAAADSICNVPAWVTLNRTTPQLHADFFINHIPNAREFMDSYVERGVQADLFFLTSRCGEPPFLTNAWGDLEWVTEEFLWRFNERCSERARDIEEKGTSW
jgi:hypothetical protein